MDTSRLSHARAITTVRDPIHDYFYLTIFDREIVDSPFFQRLHFVLQNSVTYTAFPANKNSRFSHSLGAAHLAGEMFVRAASNSSTDDLDSFLNNFLVFLRDAHGGFVDDRLLGMIPAWKKTIEGQSRFSHTPFFAEKYLTGYEVKVLNNKELSLCLIEVIWQALRIAGLVHDIGHLPMSHSFEHALKHTNDLFDIYDQIDEDKTTKGSEQSRKKFLEHLDAKASELLQNSDEETQRRLFELIANLFGLEVDELKASISSLPFHERRGLLIFLRMSKMNEFDLDEHLCNFRNLIWYTAASILFSVSLKENKVANRVGISQPEFLVTLRSIISDEVDVDRMDYTIRDGYACGTPIGRFDLNRILNYAILKSIGQEGREEYCIAFLRRAIPGLEQFFQQRYEGYKYLIHHRTSSRTESCLQELVKRLFHVSYMYPDCDIASLLKYYGYIKFNLPGEGTAFGGTVTGGGNNGAQLIGILPSDDFDLYRLDDANLRTLFFAIVDLFNNNTPNFKEFKKDKDYILTPIILLCRIVVYRDFRHVFDPAKNVSTREFLSEAIGKDISMEKYRKFSKILENSDKQDEEGKFDFRNVILNFKREVHDKFNGKISVIDNFWKSKIFDSDNKKQNNSLKLVLPDGKVNNASLYSDNLLNMKDFDKTLQFSFYFVAEDIKTIEGLRINIYNFYIDFLSNLWTEVCHTIRENERIAS